MTATDSMSASLTVQQHVLLQDVSWELYERLLEEMRDRPIRMTFDHGDLEIMAPLPLHERWKKRVARLIEALCEERDIEIDTLGSTTFRKEVAARGLEPDECYYIQHAEGVRGKNELDLAIDPPPDLAIEIDITHRSIPRQPIYASLGIPELWRFDQGLTVMLLGPSGQYHISQSSGAFPFLPLAEFERFLLRMESKKQGTVLRDFRRWLQTLG